jgi:hypothetical protein
MNYEIIKNEEILKDFINFLPELKPHETYYCSLFARKKYCVDTPRWKSDKESLKRFTSDKQFLFRKIKQLECEIGSYTNDDLVLGNDVLALYITINPRDMQIAASKGLIELANAVVKPYNGYNPHAMILNAIQQSRSKSPYFDIDYDGVTTEEVIPELMGKINCDALTFLHTRGGFHLLIKTDAVDVKYKKSWYKSLTSIKGVDVRGDGLIPVPGTNQGGFMPYLSTYKW